jgi:hypothetical protein
VSVLYRDVGSWGLQQIQVLSLSKKKRAELWAQRTRLMAIFK